MPTPQPSPRRPSATLGGAMNDPTVVEVLRVEEPAPGEGRRHVVVRWSDGSTRPRAVVLRRRDPDQRGRHGRENGRRASRPALRARPRVPAARRLTPAPGAARVPPPVGVSGGGAALRQRQGPLVGRQARGDLGLGQSATRGRRGGLTPRPGRPACPTQRSSDRVGHRRLNTIGDVAWRFPADFIGSQPTPPRAPLRGSGRLRAPPSAPLDGAARPPYTAPSARRRHQLIDQEDPP